MPSELIFYGTDWFGLKSGQMHRAKEAVAALSADAVLNLPAEDLAGEVTDQYAFIVPTLKLDDAYRDEPTEVQLTLSDYGRIIRPMGTKITLHVPFDGDSGFFRVQPPTFTLSPPRATVAGNTLIYSVTGQNLQAQQVNAAFKKFIDEAEQHLTWQREGAQQFNNELKMTMFSLVQARKQRLIADRNLAAGLNFPTKSKGPAPFSAPLVRRKLPPMQPPQQGATPRPPDPVFEESEYQYVLSIVSGMTHAMERTPKSFAKQGEEALRDMYLAMLNSHYQGTATGETFNASGKTDILIRIEDRNVFIAECKIWDGPASCTGAINQLLGYLTWRDTKAAVVMFNRNKNFTAMLRSMRETADAHPDRKSGPKLEQEGRLRYVFRSKSDPDREIIVTFLAFDTPA